MRRKLIAGNWKMNNTNKEALELVSQLKDMVKDAKDRDIMIAPTFTCLSDVNNAIKGTNIKLGAQNLYFEEKGAFTGAIDKKIGRFEAANKGTIFLDEIGEINQTVQVKLLRVLEERVIEHVGSNIPINVDIRVIAATNKKLSEEIKEGKFREDLYYRLNVIKIEMPPLRERREDIPLLIDNFIKEFSAVHSIEIKSVDKKVYKILSSLQWEGNVRELRNMIETMVVMSRDGKIEESNIPDWALKSNEEIFSIDKDLTLEELEKKYINYLLSRNNFNKAQVSKILGIERATLYRKLKEDNE